MPDEPGAPEGVMVGTKLIVAEGTRLIVAVGTELEMTEGTTLGLSDGCMPASSAGAMKYVPWIQISPGFATPFHMLM